MSFIKKWKEFKNRFDQPRMVVPEMIFAICFIGLVVLLVVVLPISYSLP